MEIRSGPRRGRGPETTTTAEVLDAAPSGGARLVGTFTIDFKVFYYWTEPKVVGRPRGCVVDIHEEGLFQPELIIANEAELQLTHWEFQVKDPKTGLLKLSESLRPSGYLARLSWRCHCPSRGRRAQSSAARMSSDGARIAESRTGARRYYRGKLLIPNMSLHHFPFDVQNLRICIKPHKKTIDELELHPLPDECAIEHHARHEWRVIGSCTAMRADGVEISSSRFSRHLGPRASGVRRRRRRATTICRRRLLVPAPRIRTRVTSRTPLPVGVRIKAGSGAAATRIVRGDESRRRRDADDPRRQSRGRDADPTRGDKVAAAGTRRTLRTRRPPRSTRRCTSSYWSSASLTGTSG